MLKKETIEKIKGYGFDVDKLIEAVKAEAEVDYAVPEFTALTTEQLTARDSNKVAEGKTEGERIGETKGKELAAKAFKRKFALEDAIPNDPEKIVEAVNTKLNKGDAGLQEQITLLQKDKEKLTADLTLEQQRAKAAQWDAELISYFPANRTADLSDQERLALVKLNYSFEESDGKRVVKKNGELLRDGATQNPIAPKAAIETLFTEKKWVAAAGGAGGRGGSDNPAGGGAGGVKTLTKFTEKWKAENPGKNEISPEFQAAVQAYAKDIPDFNYYQ